MKRVRTNYQDGGAIVETIIGVNTNGHTDILRESLTTRKNFISNHVGIGIYSSFTPEPEGLVVRDILPDRDLADLTSTSSRDWRAPTRLPDGKWNNPS